MHFASSDTSWRLAAPGESLEHLLEKRCRDDSGLLRRKNFFEFSCLLRGAACWVLYSKINSLSNVSLDKSAAALSLAGLPRKFHR